MPSLASWRPSSETDFGESHAPYPAEALTITAPGEESGTYDSFVDLVFGDIAEARKQDAVMQPDYQASPDDNVIIEGVAGTADAPYTLGFVGFAYAVENTDRVTLLPVDGGDGCTPATEDTIAAAEYPISRYLYIYPNTARADANPAVQAFVDFYLSDEGIAAVSEEGYVQLAERRSGGHPLSLGRPLTKRRLSIPPSSGPGASGRPALPFHHRST